MGGRGGGAVSIKMMKSHNIFSEEDTVSITMSGPF